MTEITPDLLNQLQSLLGKVSSDSPGAVGGWAKQAVTATPTEILGVSVPISLETPAGKIRVYLNFGAQAAVSPDALHALIAQLHAAGLPLDAWQPRESSGWNQGQGGGSRGWNNSGNFKRKWY